MKNNFKIKVIFVSDENTSICYRLTKKKKKQYIKQNLFFLNHGIFTVFPDLYEIGLNAITKTKIIEYPK